MNEKGFLTDSGFTVRGLLYAIAQSWLKCPAPASRMFFLLTPKQDEGKDRGTIDLLE